MRHAPSRVDPGFGVLRLITQIEVARTHFAASVEYAHMRSRDLVVVLAQCLQKAARGSTQQSFVQRRRSKAACHGDSGSVWNMRMMRDTSASAPTARCAPASR